MKSFHKEHLCLLGLLIFVLSAAFYDVVFLQKTFKATTVSAQALHNGPYGQGHNKLPFIPVNGTDSPVQEEPVFEFIKQNLRRGILPLWNPHQAGGYPLIGIIEIGLFYPLNLIMYLLPEVYAWDLLILSRFLVAGILLYWFMRTMRFGKIPSLAAAMSLMLSGPMVLLQYWTANVDIVAPLLLLALERLLQRPNPFNTGLLAVAISLTVFGGHPEHIFLVNVYGLLFFGFRLFCRRKNICMACVIRPWLLSYVLGIGLSAVVLFPFLRNLAGEFWHGHPPLVGLLNEEVRSRILSLALPYFFNNVPLTHDFEFSGWWGGYLGTLPLMLGFLSLFSRQRQGLNYFFAILGFLIVSKAYGFFYINWIGYLPLFNLCRYAIHTPHLVALTSAILVGMGVRAILGTKKFFFQALGFSLALMAVVVFHLIAFKDSLRLPIALQAARLALVLLLAFQIIVWLRDQRHLKRKGIGILLVIFLFGELFLYIHRERPRRFASFGEVPYIHFLKKECRQPCRTYGIIGALYPNTATGFAIDDLGIFFGLLPTRFVEFVNALIKENVFVGDLRPPALRTAPLTSAKSFLDLLNIRYIITPSTDAMMRLIPHYAEHHGHNPPPIYSHEVNIYERVSAFPRAFVVHKAIFQPDKKTGFEFLKKFQRQMSEFILINAEPDHRILASLRSVPVQSSSHAVILDYHPNEVALRVEMQYPGFLVLSDAFHPDWTVRVDGKRAKIYEANYLIRAVYLSAGEHHVRFSFRPWSLTVGAVVSGISLLIIIGFLRIGQGKKI